MKRFYSVRCILHGLLHFIYGKMKSAIYVGCQVRLSVCVCIINKICPLASVASFGDIGIIFSEQLAIVALRR